MNGLKDSVIFTSHKPFFRDLGSLADLCQLENGGCEQVCYNLCNLQVKCGCWPGFVLAYDGKTCIGKLNKSVYYFKDVRANCFCASLLRTQMHTPRHTRARALSNKMRNGRAKGHCYSFA